LVICYVFGDALDGPHLQQEWTSHNMVIVWSPKIQFFSIYKYSHLLRLFAIFIMIDV
ncbi:hypothetical protein ACJX0J_006539, partial [Zea mays]